MRGCLCCGRAPRVKFRPFCSLRCLQVAREEHDPPAPTAEEITRLTAEIQQGWTEDERLGRAKRQPYEVRVVKRPRGDR